jgi:hypothetical protein
MNTTAPTTPRPAAPPIDIEPVTTTAGTRYYITGNTYPYRETIKDCNDRWDAQRKQWYVCFEASAAAIAQRIISAADRITREREAERAADAEGLQPNTRLYGRADYKGRSYYVVSPGPDWKLASLDGKLIFRPKRDNPPIQTKAYYRPTWWSDILEFRADRKTAQAAPVSV